MFYKMAYKKYYRRRGYRRRYRRKYNRKQDWLSKKYSVSDIARGAWKGVNYLKTLVNSEMHAVDAAQQVINPSTTGSVVHVTAVAQGDDEPARTGNSLLLRGFYIRGTITINATANHTFVRCMLVRDRQQASDTSPGIGDVLRDVDVQSPLDRLIRGRFDVLWDKVYNVDVFSGGSLFFKHYVKMLSHVRYNGSASTDVQKNGLYLLFLSNEATNTPTLTYTSRLTYHDN